MVAERSEDFDVLGIADDELEAAIQVFLVRKGRVVGRKGFIVDKVEDLTPAELVSNVVERLYDEPPQGIPKTVFVPVDVDDPDLYEEWLSSLRGSKVTVRIPLRGQKRELQETVTRNAREEFVRHRLRRASDHNSRARALNELQDQLGLPDAPLRIECYDMSHIQGSDYVGSMVVLEDGLPKKSEYRRFKIKGDQGNDDFAAMEQVLTRRLTAYLAERRRPVTETAGKFLPTAAPPRRRRQGAALGGPRVSSRSSGSPTRSRLRRWPSASKRSTCRARRIRSGCRASRRRSTCCSGSATRLTASPSPSIESCAASG